MSLKPWLAVTRLKDLDGVCRASWPDVCPRCGTTVTMTCMIHDTGVMFHCGCPSQGPEPTWSYGAPKHPNQTQGR